MSKIESTEIREELLQHIHDLDQETNPEGDYISMPAKLFLHFTQIPYDIFTKVENKYIKFLNAVESFERTRIESYIGRGGIELYFHKNNRKGFSTFLMEQLQEKLQRPTKSFIEKTQASSEVYETIRDMALTLGLKPKILDICKIGVETLEKEIKSAGKNDLYRYFKLLKTEERFDFKYKVVQLTSLCCQSILDVSEWPGKADIGKKTIFASYFCDMTLVDSELVKVRTPEDFALLKPQDQLLVKEHAYRASEMLKGYPDVSQDAIKIVLQHHGMSNGIGLGSDFKIVFPPSILFYTAQEFAIRTLKQQDTPASRIINDMKNEFPKSKIEEFATLLERSLAQ